MWLKWLGHVRNGIGLQDGYYKVIFPEVGRSPKSSPTPSTSLSSNSKESEPLLAASKSANILAKHPIKFSKNSNWVKDCRTTAKTTVFFFGGGGDLLPSSTPL